MQKTQHYKVTHNVERHGKTVTVSTFVKRKVWVPAYKLVKQTVWGTVNKSIQAWNP